jgi:hypothetical protein
MTFSTSLVAVWYSSDSCRSPVRSRSSLNRRTFSIAITAWSAKVLSSSICLSLNASASRRVTLMAPIGLPFCSIGTERMARNPDLTMFGYAYSGSANKSATCATSRVWIARAVTLPRPGG